MKTMVATTCLVLALAAISSAQTNVPANNKTNSLSVAEVLRREKRLSTVESLPPSAAISNVVIAAFMNVGHGGKLTADGFRTLIDRAMPLKADDPSIFAYHYAPWCVVTFETKDGWHMTDLCLGRGFIQYPDGRVVAFDIVQQNAEKVSKSEKVRTAR